MIEGKALVLFASAAALAGTLVGSSGLAGPTLSDVLLALGTILALTLCRNPRKP